MTDNMMALRGLLEKSAKRLVQRNGDRDRVWETRAGAVERRILRLRRGRYFSSFLEPRRMPKLAGLMDEAEEDVLAYMSFPAAHRRSCTARIPWNASTARSTGVPTSSASSSTKRPSSACSAPSCWSRTTNRQSSVAAT